MAYLQFFEYFIATWLCVLKEPCECEEIHQVLCWYDGVRSKIWATYVMVLRTKQHELQKIDVAPNFRIHKTFSSHLTLLATTVVQNTRHWRADICKLQTSTSKINSSIELPRCTVASSMTRLVTALHSEIRTMSILPPKHFHATKPC